MNFRNYYVEMDHGELLIKGHITSPVMWKFVITIEKNDIRGFANIILKRGFLAYLGKNIRYFFIFFFEKIFKRKSFERPEEDIMLPADVYSIEASR